MPSGKKVAIVPSAPPRLPFLVERDRELTAGKFQDAARRACDLAKAELVAPELVAAAALEAAALSNEHNTHCRAGIPVDAATQQARRDLHAAMKALLDGEGLALPSRDKLGAACERLARLGADPNKDRPIGVRDLIYREASKWLAPHELQALAAASAVPHMPLEDFQRAQLVSAKASLPFLKEALSAACDAHVDAPHDPEIKARYQQCLKQAYCAMELVFNDAMKAFRLAEKANRFAPADLSPGTWDQRWQGGRTQTEKKNAVLGVAEDLQKVAGLRLAGLKPFCKSIEPTDGRPSAQFKEANKQLEQVRTLIAACVYAQTM